jgi:hypothetical protein
METLALEQDFVAWCNLGTKQPGENHFGKYE